MCPKAARAGCVAAAGCRENCLALLQGEAESQQHTHSPTRPANPPSHLLPISLLSLPPAFSYHTARPGGQPAAQHTCSLTAPFLPLSSCPPQDEVDSRLQHSGRSVLSMANSGKDSNGSQFFLLYKSAHHLDYKHSVFGRVVGGAHPTWHSVWGGGPHSVRPPPPLPPPSLCAPCCDPSTQPCGPGALPAPCFLHCRFRRADCDGKGCDRRR